MLGVDMCALAPEWPLGEQILSQITNLGWKNYGNSPHMGENGLWFHSSDHPVEIENTTHKVGAVIHLVRSPENLISFLAFREYCSANQSGFDAYKSIKTDLADVEGQTRMAYKIKKKPADGSDYSTSGPLVS